MLGKENVPLNRNLRPGSHTSVLVAVLCVIWLLGSEMECFSQESGSRCTDLRNQWEQLVNDLKEHLRRYQAIQKAPLERITQRPLVDYSEGKSIARQISEAIQEKERLLSTKRKECRNILNLEQQAFSALEECSDQEATGRKKQRAFKKLSKQRQRLVENAVISLTEVRAVEGESTSMPYSQAYQDPYRYGNNYWRDYQQMYRGYWGR